VCADVALQVYQTSIIQSSSYRATLFQPSA